MRKMTSIILSILLFSMVSFAHAQSENAGEILKQYISDLQKNPNDNALREKIIKHAQTMKPAPEIPEEAQRHLGRGQAAVEIAKTSEDFFLAISEFKKVLRLAPWLANAYFNLAVVQEKAGQFNEAMQNYKLYLLAAPSASDAQEVKTRIYGLELKAERQQKEEKEKSTREEREKQKQEVLNKFKRMVDGKTYYSYSCDARPYSGCNEKEYSGKNWRDMNKVGELDDTDHYHQFSFASDGKILLCSYGGFGVVPEPLCTGGVRGYPILVGEEDKKNTGSTRWTDNRRWKDKSPGEPVWIRYNTDWSSFTVGYDRPADDGGFDSSTRYNYQMFKWR
jgi:tetratricopeptide (TPR) repeat protein